MTFALSAIRSDGRDDPDTPVDRIAAHIEYIADTVGVEHVAIGSDFDGASIPDSLGDATGLPLLLDALARRGFDANERQLIARENWLRALESTWD